MIRFKTFFSKLSGFTLLITLLPSSAFAGAPLPAPVISFTGGATAVPSLSGTMLVILSLLLFIVAFKVAKQKNRNTGKFFIALLGVSAIATGSGGFKLISDVNAITQPEIINITGQLLNKELNPSTEYTFTNNNTQPLTITLTNGEVNSCGSFSELGDACGVDVDTLGSSESCEILCGDE